MLDVVSSSSCIRGELNTFHALDADETLRAIIKVNHRRYRVQILLFQHLLASYTTAPSEALCSKIAPASLLWCSMWTCPDVYKFLSDKPLSCGFAKARCGLRVLRWQAPSVSPHCSTTSHVLWCSEWTVCLSRCARFYDGAHTRGARKGGGILGGTRFCKTLNSTVLAKSNPCDEPSIHSSNIKCDTVLKQDSAST